MKTLLVVLALTQLGLGYTQNGSTYATDGSQTDFNKALHAATNGSTITLPAGTFTWGNGTVIRANINVVIKGAGADKTTVKNANNPGDSNSSKRMFDISGDGVVITGITFVGQRTVSIAPTSNTKPFRIYNCTFDNGTIPSMFVEVSGQGFGLIDHCTMSGGSASEMIHNNGAGASNTAGWTDDVTPGSASALYVENCTFSKNPLSDPYFTGTCALQSYYGARTVVRYCKLNYAHIDAHGNAPPLYGARWGEYYENTFYVPANGNQSDFFALRGGSGVVFNNHFTGGPNTGAGSIFFYTDERTNPPLCGPGAGIFVHGNQRTSSPFYLWNNDPAMSPWGQAPITAGKDFFVSATQPSTMKKWQLKTDNANTTYSYSPYQYPHPLDDLPTDQYGPVGGGPAPHQHQPRGGH